MVLIPPGVHFDFQTHAPLVSIDQEHIVGSVELVVQGGVRMHQEESHHNFQQEKHHDWHRGQHLILHQRQLEIGDEIHQEQRNGLPQNQIHPVKLAEHGAVRVLEEHIGQHCIYAHEDIFAFVGVVFNVVAMPPDDIV